MNVFELTRALVDIESITENESAGGAFLHDHLAQLAARTGGRVERMEVERGRFNVLASWGQPVVTLSTHMDTVPPFFPSREDAEFIWGRGACDAKGIIAVDDRRGGKAARRRREEFRLAVRGRRGTKQRRRAPRRAIAARLALS